MPYKDPKQRLNWHRKRRAQCRLIIDQAKNTPCTDCKVIYPPYIMQFDHVQGKKKFNIAAALAKTRSLEVVKKEIAKCEVVCANCHSERTHNRALTTKYKRNTGEY